MLAGRLSVVSGIVALLALPTIAAAQPASVPQADSASQAGAAVTPGETELAREIAERLAASGSGLSAADREDRAALA
jgi:hypothetical protein